MISILDSIDFLLFCTQTPDYPLPTTACLLQDRMGLRTDCGALDFNLGCSGFRLWARVGGRPDSHRIGAAECCS